MHCGINTAGSWVKHISFKLLAGEVPDNRKKSSSIKYGKERKMKTFIK